MIKFLALFLLSSSSLACNVGYHVHTHHFNRDAGFREDNAGNYFICPNGFTAGSYNNSEYRRSDYVGYSLTNGNVGVTIGAVTGYVINPVPIVIPSVKVGKIRLSYLIQNPASKIDTRGIHISMEL